MNQLDSRQLELHVPIVGWLMIAGNSIFLLVAACLFFLLSGIGVASGDRQALAILTVTGISAGCLLAVLAVPGILAGYGLLRRRYWGRVLAIIVNVLGLANFPVGTLISAYALWVLLQSAAEAWFSPATS